MIRANIGRGHQIVTFWSPKSFAIFVNINNSLLTSIAGPKIQIIVESTYHLAEILSSEVLYNSKILIVEIPILVISNYKKMKNNID